MEKPEKKKPATSKEPKPKKSGCRPMGPNGTYGDAMRPEEAAGAMAGLRALLEAQNFASSADAEAFFQRWMRVTGGAIPSPIPQTTLEWAQALARQAEGERDIDRAVALAQMALEISADCVDAYLMLASHEESFLHSIELLEQAVAVGRRAVAEDLFIALRGRLWAAHEARPFLRAMAQLSKSVWDFGDRKRAITGYTAILEWDADDHLEVHTDLMQCLLEERTPEAFAALRGLFERFQDDDALEAYNYALLLFQELGPCMQADHAFKRAMRTNRYIPGVLLGTNDLSRYNGEEPRPGSLGEAIDYRDFADPAWALTPGAAAWVRRLAS